MRRKMNEIKKEKKLIFDYWWARDELVDSRQKGDKAFFVEREKISFIGTMLGDFRLECVAEMLYLYVQQLCAEKLYRHRTCVVVVRSYLPQHTQPLHSISIKNFWRKSKFMSKILLILHKYRYLWIIKGIFIKIWKHLGLNLLFYFIWCEK